MRAETALAAPCMVNCGSNARSEENQHVQMPSAWSSRRKILAQRSLRRLGDMAKQKRVLVTGAGGFIGHHLVKKLKSDGHWVRGVDIKYPEYEVTASDAFEILDLCNAENCLLATLGGVDEVYNLAADMGGIGYITAYLADISRNNILINAHMLEASRQNEVQRFLFSSSACVYAQSKQKSADVTPLKEEDAHPAEPEPGYGWE